MIDEPGVIDSCQDLVPGDAVEAFYKSNLVHHGPVTDTAPELGLFWILDTLTGGRRLLDMCELEIVRLPARYRDASPRGYFSHFRT